MNWFKSFRSELAEATASQKQSEAAKDYTLHAQQALELARKEAEGFNHHFVGTEHLLLGIIRLSECRGCLVLQKMGVNFAAVRTEVEKLVGTGPDQKMLGKISYTPRSKKVLALAAQEARAMGKTQVGTEHILLGLVREGDGVAGRVLKNLGADHERTRVEVMRQVDPNYTPPVKDNSHSGMESASHQRQPNMEPIDTRKRYDIYCGERNGDIVVYRNALFRGKRPLLEEGDHGIGREFFEVEQNNGQMVYLSADSIFKFSEPGTEIVGEVYLRGKREA